MLAPGPETFCGGPKLAPEGRAAPCTRFVPPMLSKADQTATAVFSGSTATTWPKIAPPASSAGSEMTAAGPKLPIALRAAERTRC